MIFILEDDLDVARLFQRELERAGMRARTFHSLRAIRAELQSAAPDLCVLDLGLPDGDGLHLLNGALAARGVPTVVVSGRGSLDDRIAGLAQGADDYLAKPAEPMELVARIRSVLRRTSGSTRSATTQAERVASFSGWRYDPDTLRLSDPQGVARELPRADAELLALFLASQGRVVTREWLIERLFDHASEPFDRAVDVRVSRLRKKLGDDPRRPLLIRTVYGAGYVFASPVDWH